MKSAKISGSKIRIIARENTIIRDKDGNILKVLTNFFTEDFDVKSPFSTYRFNDNDERKNETVSAVLI